MEKIYRKALALDFLTADEALVLYESGPLDELMSLAWELRQKHVPGRTVTWQIDRNVNITNVCISGCKFCNFHCKPHQTETGPSSPRSTEYAREDRPVRLRWAATSCCCRAACIRKLAHRLLRAACSRDLKSALPHAAAACARCARGGPHRPHQRPDDAGDAAPPDGTPGSIRCPGAGAEILDPGVRQGHIARQARRSTRWLDGDARRPTASACPTSATMMYGHVETPRQRVDHLLAIRDLQARCPEGKYGFIAFIPWIFRVDGHPARNAEGRNDTVSLRWNTCASSPLSRLVSVQYPQHPGLVAHRGQGQTAQAALHSGANDMGSIMIEENVVSSAGAAQPASTPKASAARSARRVSRPGCETSSTGSGNRQEFPSFVGLLRQPSSLRTRKKRSYETGFRRFWNKPDRTRPDLPAPKRG